MARKRTQGARGFARVALCAALLAVLSQIVVPLPTGVPMTLQTFAVALSGFVLGSKKGGAVTGVYLALGLAGVPVFAGFTGGAAKLLGVTGGFLWGFVPMAMLCGVAANRWNIPRAAMMATAGVLACHGLGVAQFVCVTQTTLGKAMITVSLPFLVKDAASVAVAYAVSARVRRALPDGRRQYG